MQFFSVDDGTLAEFCKLPQDARPSVEVLSVLEQLTNDPCNTVFVVSGRPRKDLEPWLGHLNIGMSCEHGFISRLPGHKEWVPSVSAAAESAWRSNVLALFQKIVAVTPGSLIEEKESTLAWHCRNVADVELGVQAYHSVIKQARALVTGMEVEVMAGDKVVEVRQMTTSKGTFVRSVLQSCLSESEGSNLDKSADDTFVFAIGDDVTDETMFAAVNQVKASFPNSLSVVVGKDKVSAADYSVHDPAAVLALLQELCTLHQT
jgi:trehalose 6-phosphate synthase/phosphatase